jgi:hypothetical protein
MELHARDFPHIRCNVIYNRANFTERMGEALWDGATAKKNHALTHNEFA